MGEVGSGRRPTEQLVPGSPNFKSTTSTSRTRAHQLSPSQDASNNEDTEDTSVEPLPEAISMQQSKSAEPQAKARHRYERFSHSHGYSPGSGASTISGHAARGPILSGHGRSLSLGAKRRNTAALPPLSKNAAEKKEDRISPVTPKPDQVSIDTPLALTISTNPEPTATAADGGWIEVKPRKSRSTVTSPSSTASPLSPSFKQRHHQ